MKKYINLLSEAELFKSIPAEHILNIVESEACYLKTFEAKSIIYDVHESISHTGIVLEGVIDVLHLMPTGHESLVRRINAGSSFGTSFSLVDSVNTANSFRSVTNCTVLFIDMQSILKNPSKQDNARLQMLNNLLTSFAKSNILLNTKLQIITQKTLREKLLTYFNFLSIQAGSSEFTLPFNREQLSSYLDSERSSVCRELSKLTQEGLIKIKKNRVTLLCS